MQGTGSRWAVPLASVLVFLLFACAPAPEEAVVPEAEAAEVPLSSEDFESGSTKLEAVTDELVDEETSQE